MESDPVQSLILPVHATCIDVEMTTALCPLCNFTASIDTDKEPMLKHIIMQHHLVIGDVNLIANLHSYLDYWRQRFLEQPMMEFCTVIQTNSKETDIGASDHYYLLCDVLPEDRTLRVRLQQEKLETVLAYQQKERQDTTFCRSCLFCKAQFTGNRADLFNHMARDHNFNVGLPDNLVYTDELLDLLQQKLQSLCCLYCEKTFKDRHVLKEHMRKKVHKKIKAGNKVYDKFYVINYLELGKNWETIQQEVDSADDSDDNQKWGDWTDERGATVVCLFCDFQSPTIDNIQSHMQDKHQFSLPAIKEKLKLSFYQQVKLINFIRRRVHQLTCVNCELKFGTKSELSLHMDQTGHLDMLSDTTTWDQPEYFFSTYENDNLLCLLEVDNEEGEGNGHQLRTSVVIAEDLPSLTSLTQDTIDYLRDNDGLYL